MDHPLVQLWLGVPPLNLVVRQLRKFVFIIDKTTFADLVGNYVKI